VASASTRSSKSPSVEDPPQAGRQPDALRDTRRGEGHTELKTPWDDPVDVLPGVGGAARSALGEVGIHTVAEFAWVLPRAYDDYRAPLTLEAMRERARGGEPGAAVVAAVVHSVSRLPLRGRRGVQLVLTDEAGAKLVCSWFFAAHGIAALAEPGKALLVRGVPRLVRGTLRMAHPDVLADAPEARALRPRYPKLGGLAEGLFRKVFEQLADADVPLPEPLPEAMRRTFPSLEGGLRAIHRPASSDAPALRGALERMAFVEAFGRVRARLRAEAEGEGKPALALAWDPAHSARVGSALGLQFTRSQQRAVAAIGHELAQTTPMRRLLSGDVGTGKTAVLLGAVAQCVLAGAQVAILAPTTVLVEQYARVLEPVTASLGVGVASVTAGQRVAEKRAALASVASGGAGIVLGTHALLGADVRFARLALVVVDEQHRLGVAQRLALVQKDSPHAPHLLTVSATPIPRTLALALRGELASSILDERPPGRVAVTTTLAPRAETESVLALLSETVARGERALWVVPRIEGDDDESSIAARTDGLREHLTGAVLGVLHGGLAAAKRKAALDAFRNGETQVLLATSMIEVGIDVPEATLVVVDGAERFGLAQLHQLRGRVGRGDRPGRCVLLHGDLTAEAAQRLRILAEHADGEAVARADLALRGAGDPDGLAQHGDGGFAYLDPWHPPAWIAEVPALVLATLREDPELEAKEHRLLRGLLARFGALAGLREDAG